jgi:hypothetical protein
MMPSFAASGTLIPVAKWIYRSSCRWRPALSCCAAISLCCASRTAHADWLQTYVGATCDAHRGVVLFGYGDADGAPDYPKIEATLDRDLSNRRPTSTGRVKASCIMGDGRQILVRYSADAAVADTLGKWAVWVDRIRIAEGDANKWVPAAVIVDKTEFRVCRIALSEDQFTYGIPWPVTCDGAVTAISGPPDKVEFPSDFKPVAVVNRNPAVCGRAARELAARYPSRDNLPALGPGAPFSNNATKFSIAVNDAFHWVNWQEDRVGRLGQAEVDLEGDGETEYLLRYTYIEAGPIAPPANAAYVLTRSQLEYVKAHSIDDPSHDLEMLGKMKMYYPNAARGDESNVQGTERHDIFEFQRAYYFYDTDHLDVKPISLYRLHAGGRTELQCVFRVIPPSR